MKSARKVGDNAKEQGLKQQHYLQISFLQNNIWSFYRKAHRNCKEGIEVLEFIMGKLKSSPLGSEAAPSAQITEEEGLREMMQDERYWHPAEGVVMIILNTMLKRVIRNFITIIKMLNCALHDLNKIIV